MKRILPLFFLMSIVLFPVSCSSDIELPAEERPAAAHPVPVEMSISLADFDEAPEARGPHKISDRGVWKDGDIIWLKFSTDKGSYSDYVRYTASTKTWTLHDLGSLESGTTGKVEAYTFGDNANVDNLLNTTPAFVDAQGGYNCYAGKVGLSLQLAPATSRLRLKGAEGARFTISGLACISSYDRTSGSVKKSTDPITLTVGNNGYSPYVYCNFATPSAPQLQVLSGNYLFTRTSFVADALQTGKSGCMTLPTRDAHIGWNMESKDTKEFAVNGVKFTMKLVEHGTFDMGLSPDGNNATPIHSVTISKDYYIGETEVTQALWYAVMGQKPRSSGSQWESTYGMGDIYPAYYISWDDCQEFITKLNQLTGQTFRMPTEAEWEYAAKGGNKSQSYKYSGSNTIDEVAWYTSNSGDTTHPVATKKPNELGIYDMSGNVYEWCSDWYGDYSSAAVTDPTGAASGSNRVRRGGSWVNDASSCRTAYRYNVAPTHRSIYLGLRLAL